jgi:hypothetical protein
MRRGLAVLILVATATVGSAGTANAQEVHHRKSTFAESFTLPAGSFCTFAVRISFSGADNTLIFGKLRRPDRVIIHEQFNATDVNLATGYRLTEDDHYVYNINNSTDRFKIAGVFWHLRSPEGKIVVVQAGQLLIDLRTGKLLKATPNFNPNSAKVLCPALRG